MKLKKKPRFEAEQFELFPPSEPHQIVCCVKCGEAKKLDFHRSGDDLLYYRCKSCGFESEPDGFAPHWVK
jgi:predicted RNA-binding Zn-ribbon protein involved in translation (DUF1610 family)